MTRAVLLSIKPKFAEAILEGRKEWEYRRALPNREPRYDALLYASAPIQGIVGEFTCDAVARHTDVHNLLRFTGVKHDIHKDQYGRLIDYFEGVKGEFGALHVEEHTKYGTTIPLKKTAPQNFQYVQKEDYVTEAVI